MPENTESTGKHAKLEVSVETTNRPRRTLVSLNTDEDQALLRVTPRVRRNARRVAAVAATAVTYPPAAPIVAMVTGYHAWQDYANSTEARERRGEIVTVESDTPEV